MFESLSEFGLRDWLLILGPLFIVGVLVHGFIRMRASRNSLKVQLDKSFLSGTGERGEEDDFSMLKAELPNGGARVRSIPEQTTLNLDDDVPVLMDPVTSNDDVAEPEIKATRRNAVRVDDVEPIVPESSRASVSEKQPAASKPASPAPEAESNTTSEDTHRDGDDLPEKFVVFYIAALNEPFRGNELRQALAEQDLRFGEMDIFHRMAKNGLSTFSLVNAVEPGTFSLDSMDAMETPAVSVFMRAHELTNPVGVFDDMVSAAQAIADELGGEVKDETRSVLTPQAIAHYRQELSEYQLKYASA